ISHSSISWPDWPPPEGFEGELITSSAEIYKSFTKDQGGIWRIPPKEVLLLNGSSDIETAVNYCHDHKIQFVAQGQRHATFAESNAVCRDNTLMGSTKFMDRLLDIDTTTHSMVVEAGASWWLAINYSAPYQMWPIAPSFVLMSVGGNLCAYGG